MRPKMYTYIRRLELSVYIPFYPIGSDRIFENRILKRAKMFIDIYVDWSSSFIEVFILSDALWL